MISDNSRYMRTPPIEQRGTILLNRRERFNFNLDLCTTYVWSEGDTLDGVAYRQYGFTDLRWAILDANSQYRTEFDIKNGDILLIPSFDEVVKIVNGYQL